jgi:hypothetical protein
MKVVLVLLGGGDETWTSGRETPCNEPRRANCYRKMMKMKWEEERKLLAWKNRFHYDSFGDGDGVGVGFAVDDDEEDGLR